MLIRPTGLFSGDYISPTYREVGVMTCVQILEVVPPTKFGRAKTSKIWCDFSQLSTLIANISRKEPRN